MNHATLHFIQTLREDIAHKPSTPSHVTALLELLEEKNKDNTDEENEQPDKEELFIYALIGEVEESKHHMTRLIEQIHKYSIRYNLASEKLRSILCQTMNEDIPF